MFDSAVLCGMTEVRRDHTLSQLKHTPLRYHIFQWRDFSMEGFSARGNEVRSEGRRAKAERGHMKISRRNAITGTNPYC